MMTAEEGMATVDIGARSGTGPASDLADAVTAMRERVDGEVRFDEGTRAAYSIDASNFRQVPIGVVLPRSVEAAVEAASPPS